MIIFWEIAETFLLNVRERGNKFQKIVLLRLFLWTHRIQFWQLCRKRFQKTPERFCPLSSKGIFLNKFFSSTCCNWHIDGSFEDLARIFSKVGRLIIAQCSKIKEKINFCKKNYLPPNFFYGHVECSFDNTAQFLLTKSWNLFQSMSTKDRFFSKIAPLKLISWKQRTHFRKPLWKDSTKSRNFPLNVRKL